MGRKNGFGPSVNAAPSGFHLMHSVLTESACSSLTLLVEHKASKNTVFCVKNLRSACPNGSYGAVVKDLNNNGRSQDGALKHLLGRRRFAPFKNCDTIQRFSIDRPPTKSWNAEIAAA